MFNVSNLAYQIGWVLVKRLQAKLSRKLFNFIADYSYKKDIKGVQLLRANLRFVLDLSKDSLELETIVKAGMRSYLRYWEEVFRLSNWQKIDIDNVIKVKGLENLTKAQTSDLTVVTATAHMGNWDACGFWYTSKYGEITTVAERLEPESVYKKFVEFRNSFGIEVIPTKGQTDIFMKLIRRSKEKRMIALVADRDITKNGIEVNFGKGQAKFPVGPAALAITTKGLVLPLVSWYDTDNKLVMEFFEPIAPKIDLSNEENIKQITQSLADIFMDTIKDHPQDWHMLQNVWTEVYPEIRLNQELVN